MHDILSALIPALGWALLHFLWQGLLIGWGCSLLLALLRNARPQTRYALACGALLLCAALPLASIVSHLHATAPVAGATPAYVVFQQISTPLPALNTLAALDSASGAVGRQLAWIVAVWSAGAAVMLLRLGIGLLWVRRQTGAGNYQQDPYWQERLYVLSRRLGIVERVRLGVVAGLDSPITAGCWRPVVLVPAALITGMPAQLLEALLAHELAHIRRHDYVVNLIQSAIEVALFYHPSVWHLSRRIRAEREQIADDLAVGVLGERRSLAQALSELDRFQFATPQLAHAAHGGNLMSRIQRLLRPKIEPIGWKTVIPALGLGAACAMLYAHAASTPPALPAPAAAASSAVVAVPPPVPAPPTPPAVPPLPALPALPPPPAPPAPVAAPAKSVSSVSESTVTTYSTTHNPYVLVRGGHDSIAVSAGSGDVAGIDQLKRTVDGDFMWAKKDGRAYLIRDPAVLAQAGAAWKPVEQLGAQMDVFGRDMDAHGKVMDGLGKQLDALAKGGGSPDVNRAIDRNAAEIDKLAWRQEALGRQMAVSGERMASAGTQRQRADIQAELARLQAQMAALTRQMAPFQHAIEQQTEQMRLNQGPMHDVGQQMKEAGKPMAALGQKMRALGEQQKRAGEQADQQVRQLIEQAIASGKAEALQGGRPG